MRRHLLSNPRQADLSGDPKAVTSSAASIRSTRPLHSQAASRRDSIGKQRVPFSPPSSAGATTTHAEDAPNRSHDASPGLMPKFNALSSATSLPAQQTAAQHLIGQITALTGDLNYAVAQDHSSIKTENERLTNANERLKNENERLEKDNERLIKSNAKLERVLTAARFRMTDTAGIKEQLKTAQEKITQLESKIVGQEETIKLQVKGLEEVSGCIKDLEEKRNRETIILRKAKGQIIKAQGKK